MKWDKRGTGSLWGSRGRSGHGGDPRPRAQERSDRDLIVPDSRRSILGEPLARRSQHGVQPGTGSLQWWLWGEARGPARAQLSSRAASRRARGEARGNHGKGTCNLSGKVSVASRTKQDLGVFVLARKAIGIAFL